MDSAHVGDKRFADQDHPSKLARVAGDGPSVDIEDILVPELPTPFFTCINLMCHAMVHQDQKIKRDKIVAPSFRRKHNEAHRFHNTLLRMAVYTQGEKLAHLTSNAEDMGFCVELCLLYHDDPLLQDGWARPAPLERQDKCAHTQCIHVEARLHRAAHTTENSEQADLQHEEVDQRRLPRHVRMELDAVRDSMRALLNSPFLQASK